MTNYYVSQIDGNDSNDGLAETDEGGGVGPWLTLGKADNLSGDQSDNSVLLRRGGTWREFPVIGANGTSGHPFTWGAYNTGDDPKVYGSTAVTSWTEESSHIWYSQNHTSDPGALWFLETDDSINYGHMESAKNDLDAEYDWWYDSGNDYIYVYCEDASGPGTAYASVEKPNQTYTLIQSNNNNYVTFENLCLGFCVSNAIRIYGTSTGCIVQDCEMYGTWSGSRLDGPDNVVTNCHIHDLTLKAADASGAMGVLIENSGNEVSYCLFERCRGISTAYGYDGGCVELYGDCDDCYIHHNWAYQCEGFLEAGAASVVTVSDVRIEYNITLDNGRFTGIRNSGSFEIDPDNFHVYHNTCVETSDSPQGGVFALLSFNTTGDSGDFYFRNNIVYADGVGQLAINWTTFDHDHNDYYLVNSFASGLNITPDATDITDNPLFSSYGGTEPEHYKITSSSPCRDVGADLSLTEDYFGNAVPYNVTPDIGAHEYTLPESPFIPQVIIIG